MLKVSSLSVRVPYDLCVIILLTLFEVIHAPVPYGSSSISIITRITGRAVCHLYLFIYRRYVTRQSGTNRCTLKYNGDMGQSVRSKDRWSDAGPSRIDKHMSDLMMLHFSWTSFDDGVHTHCFLMTFKFLLGLIWFSHDEIL